MDVSPRFSSHQPCRRKPRPVSSSGFACAHSSQYSSKLEPKLVDGIFNRPQYDIVTNLLKFLSGGLAQSGWHSPTAIKEEVVRRALEKTGRVEGQIGGLITAGSNKVPLVMADYIIQAPGELSFGSTFLREANECVGRELKQSVLLLASMASRLDGERLRQQINEILGTMGRSKALQAYEQIRLCANLMMLDARHDRAGRDLHKAIQRRLNRVVGRHREVSRYVLPQPPAMAGRRR